MNASTTRLSPRPASSRLALIALAAARPRLPPLRAPAPARSPCRPARTPAQLILQPCTLRHRARQLRRRLRHARRAREPARPAVAADRAAGHPHPGALGAPGRADLPPRGRARAHEHGLPEGEPLRRRPRRRARRLPRRRRLVVLDCPRGRVGAASTPPTSSATKSFRAVRRRVPRLRRPAPRRRRRPRRLHAARARRRPRGRARARSATTASTCSARAPARAPR